MRRLNARLSLAFSAFCVLSPAAADELPRLIADSPTPAAAYAAFSGLNAAAQAPTEARAAAYDWRGTPPEQPDWGGVGRDVGYFLGYQFAAIAVLYAAPESISGWDREQKRNYSFAKWRDNISHPVWDDDRWWLNYVLHPYWGGAYYVQARERGLDRPQALLYSALLSAIFEYGAEALAEPVSAQDLVVTPVVGALVGEYLFTPLRARIRAKPGELSWVDKTLLVVTDPLGVLSAETDRVFGIKATLRWQPIGLQVPAMALDGAAAGRPVYLRSPKPVWGVQFRTEW
ncbi:DUF3943 domain-containing protein [Thiobacillus sp.]